MEKNRYIQMILYFGAHPGEFLSSGTLAAMCGVSAKTVKKDMPLVASLLSHVGGRLEGVTGQGYKLEIVDEEAFNAYRSRLQLIDYYRLTFEEYDDILIMVAILKRLLASDGEGSPVIVSELADELFIPQIRFQKLYRKCVYYLSTYHISVTSVPNYGTTITGSEMAVRMALLSLGGFEGPNTSTLQDPHTTPLYSEDPQYRAMRKLVLQTLREQGYSLREDIPNGISYYLLIASRRKDKSGQLPLPPERQEQLKQTHQYRLAEAIISRLDEALGQRFSTSEPSLLASYLLCNHDFSREEIHREDPMGAAETIDALHREAAAYIADNFGLTALRPDDSDYLYSLLAKLTIRRLFQAESYSSILSSYHTADTRRHPLELQMARMLVQRLEQLLSLRCNLIFLTELSYFFTMALDHCRYEQKKNNVVIVSPLGTRYARILANDIMNAYGDRIESIRPMELYEIRSLPFDQIDLVILEKSVLTYYRYPIPSFVLTENNLDALGRALENENVIQQYCQKLAGLIRQKQLPHDLSRKDWAAKLVENERDHLKDPQQLILWHDAMTGHIDCAPSGRVYYFPVPWELAGRAFISCYPLSGANRQRWFSGVRFLLMYALPPEALLIKTFQLLCHRISGDDAVLDRLLSTEDRTAVLEKLINTDD